MTRCKKAPRLLDAVHKLIEERSLIFALSSSSARKLKRGGANLLAGRAFLFHLFPFTSLELEEDFDLQKVLAWGKKPVFLEIKSGDFVVRKQAARLSRIAQDHEATAIIVSQEKERKELEGVACVHWQDYLNSMQQGGLRL